MRTLLAGELEQAQDYSSGYFVKLEVQNGSGTWIDVGAALGTRWIVNVTWGEHRDTPVAQATFTLVRNIGAASLAPLMSASVLNVDDALAYAPLLNIGRSMRAFTATMAQGVTLDPAKYRPAVTGRIDDVFVLEDGEGRANMITLPCSDLGGWLMDLQIETEGTEYGNPTTPPTLESVLQSVIDDNIPTGEPAVTLVKQSSSLFGVTGWKQGETKLLEGLITLVLDSTGEDVRYRFDAAHVSQLMWFNPDRSRITVDATFTAEQYLMRRVDLSLKNIRNAGEMSYTDSATGASGVVTAEDALSIGPPGNYRRRFFRVPSSKMLTTGAESQAVINAVVNDLSGPPAEAVAELPFCWFVQLYDRYTFAANGKQYDQDQTFAVGGYQHTIENGRGSTTLTPLTARIVGAYAAWGRRGLSSGTPDLRILNFREIARTATEITVGWNVSGAVEELWLYLSTQALPVSSDPWAVLTGVPTARLTSDTTTYTVPIPGVGTITYGRLVPMSASAQRGQAWDFTLQGAAEGLKYTSCIARITSSDATTVTVTVEGLAAVGTPTVQLVEVLGSATKASGPNVGIPSASGTVWVFNRGAFQAGVGQARFRSVLADYENDDDLVTIEEQGRDTVYLATRARVLSVTVSTVVVRVAVADPYPQGANSVSLAYVEQNTGAATSPTSPQLITPAATLTEGAGTYADFTITRPAFGAGSGRVTFTATASGRVTDSDAVDVEEVGRDTVYLTSRARVTATTPTTVTVRYAVADPYPQGAASVTITYQNLGSGGVAPVSGGTVTPVATLTEAAGTYIDYTITRPAFGVGAGRVTFTATAANRTTDSDAVDIPEADRDTVYLASRARVTATTPTTVTVRVAVADPYPQGANTATITYGEHGLGAATSPGSGGTVTPAATITEDAGTYVDYTVTRPAFGVGAGRITFTVTAANRTSDSDAVDVPEVDRDTVPLLLRAKVQSTSATQVVVRVALSDPVAQSGINGSIAYVGVGTVTPTSPQSVASAGITADIDTTGTVDFTITRPAYGSGTERVTFTGSRANRTSDSDAVDVPENTTATVPAGTQTKTMRITHPAFAPSLNTTVYERLSHKTSPNSNASVEFYAPVFLPVGVTIIAFRAHWYLLDSGTAPNHGTLGSSLLRITSGGSAATVSGLSATKGAGVTYVTDASGALSELASSGRHYVVSMSGGSETNGGTHAGGSIGFSWVEIDYTMPSYDKTL